jgi:hypothetical protein
MFVRAVRLRRSITLRPPLPRDDPPHKLARGQAFLAAPATRIINDVRGINRVVVEEAVGPSR